MRVILLARLPATITLAAMLLMPAWLGSQEGTRLQIVPAPQVLSRPDAGDVRVFMLSPGEMLVEVPPGTEEFQALPAVALGAAGALPLYIGPGGISREALASMAGGEGIEVLFDDADRVIFQATPEVAFRLYRLGYEAAPVELTPVSELVRLPDARPMYDGLAAQRPLSRARTAFMKSMAESASADSLLSTIYFLSYDAGAEQYRSRFAPRYDLDKNVRPEVYARLRGYVLPAGGNVHLYAFGLDQADQFKGQAQLGTNVEGRKPGAKTSAYYIICGHYDATASRDPGFDTTWTEWPAPGADDNATGAAGVLECARLIAPMALDFGVRFILFSAEENLGHGGMTGSRDYVSYTLSETDSIIGVINLDMIGYSVDYKKAEISYGWRSDWLVSELLATADSLDLETDFEGFQRPYLFNSDHSSFWRVAIPALMLSERNEDEFPIPIYPYYHSAADTLGNLDMVQVRDNVALVVAYFSRFADLPADSLADIEVKPASVEFEWDGRSAGFPFVAGESLTVNVRALNVGGRLPDNSVYMFRLWQGRTAGGAPAYEAPLTVNAPPGGTALATTTFETSPAVYGDIPYYVSLLPVDDGVESDLTNNETPVMLTITPANSVLREFHVYPNPLDFADGAYIAGEILTSRTDFLANYVVQVFDVTGQRLLKGEGQIDEPQLEIPLTQLSGDGSGLVPGLYVCVIKLNVRDESAHISATTKFAVVSGR
jgi:hypothetical protein